MLNSRNKRFGCGTIGLLVVFLCAGALLLPRLFGGVFGGDNTDIGAQSVPTSPADVDNPPVVNSTGNVDLGPLVVTTAVDRDGCPVDDVNRLDNVDAFYVVAPNSEVAANTDVFARLYRDGGAVEDVPIITADRDYSNTCINFIFEHLDGSFPPGEYEVEFWVNGNAYDSVTFRID